MNPSNRREFAPIQIQGSRGFDLVCAHNWLERLEGAQAHVDEPMADHDAFDGFLNTLENLIESNGVDNYLEVSDDLCEAVEGLNEVLELNFNVVQQATLHWDGRLQQRPRAFQQMVHLLKSSGVEKNLWKRIMPSLIFARLTNKGLNGAERWKPPRTRRKRKHVHKKKKLAGMTYIISVKKMLKQALEENDKEAVDQIMVEMRRNLPFGSSASIVEGVQEFHDHDCEERSLRQKQKKLRENIKRTYKRNLGGLYNAKNPTYTSYKPLRHYPDPEGHTLNPKPKDEYENQSLVLQHY